MVKNSSQMTEENIKKLNTLRSLPRGINVESRIAAIKDLLGETEVFKTIQNLRWPKGILCPRCHSMNVVRTNPPKDAPDQRSHYECLQCQKENDGDGDSGSSSFFDDLTGLPIDNALHDLLHHVQNWILCWYLIGFCSLTQISKVLGLSLMQIMEMAELGTQISDISNKDKASLEYSFFAKSPKEKSHLEAKQKDSETLDAELQTRSESRNPFKPGPKSKL